MVKFTVINLLLLASLSVQAAGKGASIGTHAKESKKEDGQRGTEREKNRKDETPTATAAMTVGKSNERTALESLNSHIKYIKDTVGSALVKNPSSGLVAEILNGKGTFGDVEISKLDSATQAGLAHVLQKLNAKLGEVISKGKILTDSELNQFELDAVAEAKKEGRFSSEITAKSEKEILDLLLKCLTGRI